MSGPTVLVCVSVSVIGEASSLLFKKGLVTKGVLSTVGHVQKAVLVLLLVVQLAHRQTETHTTHITSYLQSC